MSVEFTKWTLALGLIAATFAATALAQKPDAKGGVVVTSEPGRAAVVRAAEISARVVGIDKATRTVTLKGPQGNVVDVVAGDEVRNFAQIKLGDFVVARYVEALTLELKKTRVEAGDVTVSKEAARAKPGAQPAVAGAREVTAIVDVTAVDPRKARSRSRGRRATSGRSRYRTPTSSRSSRWAITSR